MSTKVKQVIVIRKDLNMRKGKMIAQGAHASMKIFFDLFYVAEDNYQLCINITKPMREWINGKFTKIVVYVNSEKELKDLYNKAIEKNIIASLIIDSGLTEFNNIPTPTAIAIGPDYSEKIDELTKDLKLL